MSEIDEFCAIILKFILQLRGLILTRLYDAEFFSSRLLGQNRFFDEPGAVMDISWQGNNQEIAELYQVELSKLLVLLPVKNYVVKVKVFNSGINIAISYPYDLLMVACEILDWVWYDVVDWFDKQLPVNLARSKRRFVRIIKEHQQLLLRKIYQRASKQKLNFFVDKDSLILGSGVTQFRAELSSVTKISDIPWRKIANVPCVLITGTNGKTTTTRLTEFICRRAKLKSGYCSSDWVMVNGKRVIEGDLSGPSGHQQVLMHPQVEVAILEVARGGLVKRGLLPNYVTAATVTNISYDHIGQNGIENLSDLAEAKGIVYRAINPSGIAVINLDDEYIRDLSTPGIRKAYLSTKLSEHEISIYLNSENFVVFLENGYIILKTWLDKLYLNKINLLPVTIHGLAHYNNENILHAVSLCFALGLSPQQISRGLSKFGADEKSNFGRWNHYTSIKYGHLVVDIAHNPAGLANILDLAQGFRELKGLTGKFGLLYGITADRRDTIPEIVALIISHKVEELIIKEFQTALRGSEVGEMPELFYNELIKQGFPAASIKIVANETDAVNTILAQAQAEDMNLLCVHEHLTTVTKQLRDIINHEKKPSV